MARPDRPVRLQVLPYRHPWHRVGAKPYSPNFHVTEFYEVRMTPTRLGPRSLRATPYPTIQLLENRFSVLGALLVIANLPKVFG